MYKLKLNTPELALHHALELDKYLVAGDVNGIQADHRFISTLICDIVKSKQEDINIVIVNNAFTSKRFTNNITYVDFILECILQLLNPDYDDIFPGGILDIDIQKIVDIFKAHGFKLTFLNEAFIGSNIYLQFNNRELGVDVRHGGRIPDEIYGIDGFDIDVLIFDSGYFEEDFIVNKTFLNGILDYCKVQPHIFNINPNENSFRYSKRLVPMAFPVLATRMMNPYELIGKTIEYNVIFSLGKSITTFTDNTYIVTSINSYGENQLDYTDSVTINELVEADLIDLTTVEGVMIHNAFVNSLTVEDKIDEVNIARCVKDLIQLKALLVKYPILFTNFLERLK